MIESILGVAALWWTGISGAALSSPEPVTCDEEQRDLGVQQAMNMCAWADFQDADEKLNIQWELTVAHVQERDRGYGIEPGDGQSLAEGVQSFYQTLLEGQRAWLKYRDYHCEAESHKFWEGSMMPMAFNSCRTALTKERTAQLHELTQEG